MSTMTTEAPTTTNVVTPTIDLETAIEMLNDAVTEAKALHGEPFGDSRRTTATQTRRLLHLADTTTLAGSIVRNAYWAARGEDSYGL